METIAHGVEANYSGGSIHCAFIYPLVNQSCKTAAAVVTLAASMLIAGKYRMEASDGLHYVRAGPWLIKSGHSSLILAASALRRKKTRLTAVSFTVSLL